MSNPTFGLRAENRYSCYCLPLDTLMGTRLWPGRRPLRRRSLKITVAIAEYIEQRMEDDESTPSPLSKCKG